MTAVFVRGLQMRFCGNSKTKPSCRRLKIHVKASADLVGFANLCIDVRIPVKRLPRQIPGWRAAYFKQIETKPPEDSILEPGGVSNALFTASRLGLNASAVAHLGDDAEAKFCKEALSKEKIDYVEAFSAQDLSSVVKHPFLTKTATCLVIVDQQRRHLFCSQFQIHPGPVYLSPKVLMPEAIKQIQNASAFHFNGFCLQECSTDIIIYLMDEAIRAGTPTFFDPGPFGVSFTSQSAENRMEMEEILSRSNVILATQEEAQDLTGIADPVEAGKALLRLGGVVEWVVIKLGPRGSLFFRKDSPTVQHTSGFLVEVSDTVGCGDSFAAAVIFGYLQRQGGEPKGVMELANAVGAVTATGLGAGRNVANLAAVRSLLLSHLSARSNGETGLDAALSLLGVHRYKASLVRLCT